MKKYIMILIIILGVICCDLAFCQLDKSVLIIHYGDVNYYAENENYWAEINGRNVEFTDKKSENKKIIKLDFVPNQIALGMNHVFILKCGDNYSSDDAVIYSYDFEGHYIEARHEKKCNYMAMDKDILYLQYWQDEEQNMPYVNYNGIVANAWIKEDKFASKVNTMKENKKGVCKVGERTFYANSNGCFSTEKEYSNIPAMSSYIWDEMKTEKQKNADYQKVLEKEIGYDSDFLYGFNEYQKGKYIYGVVNIWEEDVRLRNMEIPINNVVKSYVYKVNLQTNDVEILFQRNKGCVQIASNETNAICYEKNMIQRINLKTQKSDILYNGLQNKTENIYLQGPYLLVAGENKYIQYDAAY